MLHGLAYDREQEAIILGGHGLPAQVVYMICAYIPPVLDNQNKLQLMWVYHIHQSPGFALHWLEGKHSGGYNTTVSVHDIRTKLAQHEYEPACKARLDLYLLQLAQNQEHTYDILYTTVKYGLLASAASILSNLETNHVIHCHVEECIHALRNIRVRVTPEEMQQFWAVLLSINSARSDVWQEYMQVINNTSTDIIWLSCRVTYVYDAVSVLNEALRQGTLNTSRACITTLRYQATRCCAALRQYIEALPAGRLTDLVNDMLCDGMPTADILTFISPRRPKLYIFAQGGTDAANLLTALNAQYTDLEVTSYIHKVHRRSYDDSQIGLLDQLLRPRPHLYDMLSFGQLSLCSMHIRALQLGLTYNIKHEEAFASVDTANNYVIVVPTKLINYTIEIIHTNICDVEDNTQVIDSKHCYILHPRRTYKIILRRFMLVSVTCTHAQALQLVQ